MICHQRQQPMRGCGGDDFQFSKILEATKLRDEITTELLIKRTRSGEARVIHLGQLLKLRLPMGATDFFVGKRDEFVEMLRVTGLQQRITQHRAERGRQRHGDARFHVIALPAIHHLNQRQIGFGDGLEQPAFFQKLFVFRMPDVRQMRVEDDGKVAGHD